MIFLVNDTLLLLFIENWLLSTFFTNILPESRGAIGGDLYYYCSLGFKIRDLFSGLGSSAAEGIKHFGF